MEKLSTVFVILMAFSMVNSGHGACDVQDTGGDQINVNCVDSLDDLTTINPQYEYIDRYDYYRGNIRDKRRRNKIVNLDVTNVDLDSLWTNEHQYMNENIQTLSMNKLNRIPDKIKSFRNLIEFKTGNDNVLNEIDLNVFLSLSKLKDIKITYSSVINVHENYDAVNSNIHVNEINLSNNFIKSLPNSCFANFPQLKTLNISHNMLNNIGILTFEGIQNLKYLDISYNNLKVIGHNFVRFVNVMYINLSNNNLTKIEESNFVTMIKLATIDLSYNQLEEIEDMAFQNLENMYALNLSNNKLTKITKNMFKNNFHLQSLSLTNNPIQIIESETFQGNNISYFNVDGVKSIEIIENRTFDGIVTDDLNLSFGKISSLKPEAFSGLQVRVLDLSNNKLNNISLTSFKSIHILGKLDLANNNLSSIEFQTADLKQLLIFVVQNNNIAKISRSFFEHLESLIKLDLSYNKISGLEPETFSKLSKLEILDISNNLISNSLKANTFQGLVSVKNIQLNNNKFAAIENKTFYGLTSLSHVNLSYGELSNIEYEAFENTGSIEMLDITHNMLRNFTVHSTSIASVKELHLNDNAISNITTEMIGPEKLYLANNNIIKLYANVFTLSKNLKILDLSSNNGIHFEEIFFNFNMTYLFQFIISNVRKQFNFEHFDNITIYNIDMSNNDIENLNVISIYKIHDIQLLNLKTNKIRTIDKFSFQSMPTLTKLDLSDNLITFIQPGSFLHTNALKSLNLHGNSIPALQFGVLDGLTNLESLNLSSNAIHEFEATILHKTPAIAAIALDNNVIENIKFDEFISLKIKNMTIGGNPISCHIIADIKKRKDIFTVTAESLDYHSENVDGIKCVTNYVFNQSFSIAQNKSDFNGTASFWLLAKTIDSFSEAIENLRSSLEIVNSNNKSKENESQRNILDILKSIDAHTANNSYNISTQFALIHNNTDSINKLYESIETFIHNVTKLHSTAQLALFNNSTSSIENLRQSIDKLISNINNTPQSNQNNNDYYQETLNRLNTEKDKMIKDMHSHFANLNQRHNTKADDQEQSADNHGELKGVLYFIAVCLSILTLLLVSSMLFIFIRKGPLKRDGYQYCSSQPISNVMELQSS